MSFFHWEVCVQVTSCLLSWHKHKHTHTNTICSSIWWSNEHNINLKYFWWISKTENIEQEVILSLMWEYHLHVHNDKNWIGILLFSSIPDQWKYFAHFPFTLIQIYAIEVTKDHSCHEQQNNLSIFSQILLDIIRWWTFQQDWNVFSANVNFDTFESVFIFVLPSILGLYLLVR